MSAVTGRGYADRDVEQSPNVRLADVERRIDKVIQYGTVEDVDHDKHLVRIRIGPKKQEQGSDGSGGTSGSGSGSGSSGSQSKDNAGYLTDWRPYHVAYADANRIDHRPLQKGAQVTYLSPTGDPAQGFVIGGKYQKAHTSWSKNGNVYGSQYKDKGQHSYNVETGEHLHIAVKKSTRQVGKVGTVITADGTHTTTIGPVPQKDGQGDGKLTDPLDPNAKDDGKRTIIQAAVDLLAHKVNDKVSSTMTPDTIKHMVTQAVSTLLSESGITHSAGSGQTNLILTAAQGLLSGGGGASSIIATATSLLGSASGGKMNIEGDGTVTLNC